MSSIWLSDEHVSLRSYTASVKGMRAIVKVEIEVTNPGALGYLLEDLERAKRENGRKRAEDTAREHEARKSGKKPKTVGHEPMLALPYFGGDKP